MNINLICAAALALETMPVSAKEKPFEQVAETVRDRTGRQVRWQREVASRNEARAAVRVLIKKPLTIAGAIRIALLNNRGLQASFEEIGLSLADLRQARMLANPAAELAVKFPDRAPTAPMYEWGLAQNFLSVLMIPLRVRVAREQLEEVQLRLSDEVVQLVAAVKSAYYDVLADEHLLSRLRVIFELHGSSLELMQNLHAAGNITDLALLQEQAEYSRARLEIATTEVELRAHREKLTRLLGVWGAETGWKLAANELPQLPTAEVSIQQLEKSAVAHRLDLAAARANLARIVRAARLEKTFRFFGALDFGIAGEHEPDGANLTGPSMRLELPLFDQGQTRIARNEAQLRMATAKFEQLAVEIRSTVRELRDRLIAKREVVRFYREELLPMRSQITALTLAQYNAMVLPATDVFRARRETSETERMMIAAMRDYWVTRAELERAVGGDLVPPETLRSASDAKLTTTTHSRNR
ncbi:MAG TPA: TolC family protein [Chthoniobacteraceae bacterium]|nr:TolC family protein [Chthoniobacteraceae bacterium]